MNKIELIRVVIVGTYALKTSIYVFRKKINKLNKVDDGRFGNFYTKTYETELNHEGKNSNCKRSGSRKHPSCNFQTGKCP